MSFNLNFFIFRLSNALFVNTKSLFKLICNIFFITTAADKYIHHVGTFAIEIGFENKWLMPIPKFKEFSLYNTITTKATLSLFCCFDS